MKASEIQIGDWLYYKGRFNAFPFKVEQVTKHKIGYHAETGENRLYYLRLNEVQPIPLTPEILEKNGFYYDEDRKAYLMGVIFQVKPERYGLFSFEICGCPYPLNTVHQLQHALRLCGIEKEIIL